MEGSKEKLDQLYKKLSASLPKEAIQRASKDQTQKGYDTTGFGYQYLVNRFNEVLGIGNWKWSFKVVKETAGKFRNGKPFVDMSVSATIKVRVFDEWVSHTEPGGHRSSNYTDARKGASTNAFKKCAAFYGVGKDAFEGSIDQKTKGKDPKKSKGFKDDDNRDQGGKDEDIKKITSEMGADGKKKMSVMEVNAKIDKIDHADKVIKMEEWIERNLKNYTEMQINVMKRRLEEQVKTLK